MTQEEINQILIEEGFFDKVKSGVKSLFGGKQATPQQIAEFGKKIDAFLTSIEQKLKIPSGTLRTAITTEPIKSTLPPSLIDYIVKMYSLKDKLQGSSNVPPVLPTPAQPEKEKEKEKPQQNVPPVIGELPTKYASFINDIKTQGVIDSIKTMVVSAGTSKDIKTLDNKTGDANTTISFKVNPDGSYYFKARIGKLNTTLGHGSADPVFTNLRGGLARSQNNKNFNENLDEAAPVAKAPIKDATSATTIIIQNLANVFATKNKATAETNQNNPDNKNAVELAKDYVSVLTPILKPEVDNVSKSWDAFVKNVVSIKTTAEKTSPIIKGKPFVVGVSSTKSSVYFGKSDEERTAAGLPPLTKKKAEPAKEPTKVIKKTDVGGVTKTPPVDKSVKKPSGNIGWNKSKYNESMNINKSKITEAFVRQKLEEAGLWALLKSGAGALLKAGAMKVAKGAITQALSRGSQIMGSKGLEAFEARIDSFLANMAKELGAGSVDELRKSLKDENFRKTLDSFVVSHLDTMFSLKDRIHAAAMIARSVQTRTAQGIPPVLTTPPAGGTPPTSPTTPTTFEPKDLTVIRGEGAADKPLMDGAVYQYFNKQWNLVTKTGLQPLDNVGKKTLIAKLTQFAKDGRDDKKDVVAAKATAGSPAAPADVIKQIKENYNSYKQFYV